MTSTRTQPLIPTLVSRLALVIALVAGLAAVATFIGTRAASASQTDCLSYGYACTPGYTGSNAAGTWAWSHYGGSYAVTPNGYHNCTLYAALRLEQNGMGDPGNWGNAVDWASHNRGGNTTPAVGSIAWWGSEVGGGFGHVAYVDQVNGTQVHVVADNYSTTKGYTDSGWIAASSVDKFLHPHDVNGGGGSQPAGGSSKDFNSDGRADIAWHEGSTLTTLSGQPNGTFGWAGATGGIGFDWIGAGDFRGDGKSQVAVHVGTDLVVLEFNNGQWQWFNVTHGIGKPDFATSSTAGSHQ